jgi:hypothetical protein
MRTSDSAASASGRCALTRSQVDPELARRALRFAPFQSGAVARGVPQHRKALQFRQHAFEQLQALASELRRDDREAGEISARARKGLHDAQRHRVVHMGDHRQLHAGALYREHRFGVVGENHIDLRSDELGGKRRDPFEVPFGGAVFDDEVAFDVAQLAQPRQKGSARGRRRVG